MRYFPLCPQSGLSPPGLAVPHPRKQAGKTPRITVGFPVSSARALFCEEAPATDPCRRRGPEQALPGPFPRPCRARPQLFLYSSRFAVRLNNKSRTTPKPRKARKCATWTESSSCRRGCPWRRTARGTRASSSAAPWTTSAATGSNSCGRQNRPRRAGGTGAAGGGGGAEAASRVPPSGGAKTAEGAPRDRGAMGAGKEEVRGR